MKTNAIVRIVVWSLVIVLLSTCMVGVLVYPSYAHQRRSHYSVAATLSPSGAVDEFNTKNAAEPYSSSEDEFNAKNIADPSVSSIEIDWAVGSVTIQTGDVDAVTFMEDGCTDPQYAMVWTQKNNRLEIQFSQKTSGFQGISSGKLSKNLTVLVPENWSGKSIRVDSASAQLEVTGLTVQEMEIDSASGTSRFTDCAIGELDVDTASGDVFFSGMLNDLDCDAASANVYAELQNVPREISMDSASGNLELTLPKEAGFLLKIDGIGNNVQSEFDTVQRNDGYLCGDGYCEIEMDTMSGNVILHQAPDPVK